MTLPLTHIEDSGDIEIFVAMSNLNLVDRSVAKYLEYYNYEVNLTRAARRRWYTAALVARGDVGQVMKLYKEYERDPARVANIKNAVETDRRNYPVFISKHITPELVNAILKRYPNRSEDHYVKRWFFYLHPRYTLVQVRRRFSILRLKLAKEEWTKFTYLMQEYYNYDFDRAEIIEQCFNEMEQSSKGQYLKRKYGPDSIPTMYLSNNLEDRISAKMLKLNKEPINDLVLKRKFESIMNEDGEVNEEEFYKMVFFRYGHDYTKNAIVDIADGFILHYYQRIEDGDDSDDDDVVFVEDNNDENDDVSLGEVNNDESDDDVVVDDDNYNDDDTGNVIPKPMKIVFEAKYEL
ncbi:uncharacterized protein LOC119082047 [Bradysia coprophila]|uniref:uncharacterized protein LOC119082047 n=1 Tax=Bradysia coprophila TaxID=38358 RepID=UPI00187DCBC3|nr:uncharacterized protein LOC119082047 [Bradysia coprophila]